MAYSDFTLSELRRRFGLTVFPQVEAGIPQCLAELVAAQRFNQSEGCQAGTIYGAVTTGVLWRFLTLNGVQAWVDGVEYPIQNSRKLFGRPGSGSSCC
jgi:hypothetical protein